MAIVAGNIFMFPIERKPGLVVIEIGECPVVRSVAPGTIGKTINSVLSSMVILVAACAGLFKACKSENFRVFASGFCMARAAGLLFMGSGNGEFCLCMIKRDLTPDVFCMAAGAAGFRVILRIEESGMNILVAITAFTADFPE